MQTSIWQRRLFLIDLQTTDNLLPELLTGWPDAWLCLFFFTYCGAFVQHLGIIGHSMAGRTCLAAASCTADNCMSITLWTCGEMPPRSVHNNVCLLPKKWVALHHRHAKLW